MLPRVAATLVTLLAWTATLTAQDSPPAPEEFLRPGTVTYGAFADGARPSQEYWIEVKESGVYHLEMRSLDIACSLQLEGAEGQVLEGEQNHSRAWARFPHLELASGQRYRLIASSRNQHAGWFNLRFFSGPSPDHDEAGWDQVLGAEMKAQLEHQVALLGEQNLATERTQEQYASYLYYHNDPRGALALHQRAEQTLLHHFGDQDPRLWSLRISKAWAHYSASQFKEALALHQRLEEFWRQNRGEDHPNRLSALQGIAMCAGALSDFTSAIEAYGELIEVRSRLEGENADSTLEAIDLRGRLLREAGRDQEAVADARRFLAGQQKTAPDDLFRLAVAHNNLASALLSLLQIDEALQHGEEALRLMRLAVGDHHDQVAAVLNTIGATHRMREDYPSALPFFREAYEIAKDLRGESDDLTLTTMGNFALALSNVGQVVEAERLTRRQIELQIELTGEDHPDVVTALGVHAGELVELGRGQDALEAIHRALDISRRVLGPDHPLTIRTLGLVGSFHWEFKDFAQAADFQRQALAANVARYGPEHPEAAMARYNLAASLVHLGRADEAWTLRQQALESLESNQPEGSANLADLLNVVAWNDLIRGDTATAVARRQRGSAMLRRFRGAESPVYAICLQNDAIFDFWNGHPNESFAHRLQGMRLDHDWLRQVFWAIGESERFTLMKRTRYSMPWLASIAMLLGDPDRHQAFLEELLDWRGMAARSFLAGADGGIRGHSPQQLELLEQVRATQRQLSKLAFQRNIQDLEAHRLQVEALTRKRGDLEIALNRLGGGDEAVLTPRRSLDEIGAAFGEGVALLVFEEYHPLPDPVAEPTFVSFEQITPHLSAWIYTSGGSTTAVDLGPRAEIEGLVGRFLKDLVVSRGGASLTRTEESEPLADQLYRVLWQPLAPLLRGVERIVVVPSGVLGTMPFEVLSDPDGRFLIEDHAFVYLQHPASLVDQPGRAETAAPSLLAVGGVDYLQRDQSADPAESRGGFARFWARLPQTAYEAQVVRDLHAAFYEDGTRQLIQGTAAHEAALKRALPGKSIIHIATHGFFQPDGVPSLWDAALALGEEEQGEVRVTQAKLLGRSPGLLSGLVCAGANRPDPTDSEDGLLTAEEVQWLDLSAARLVVLSACETALGQERSGQGMMSLRRAFQMAGARAVISSLWSVKDDSTSELMQSFYEKMWIDGMAPDRALRSAQLDMLRRQRARGEDMPSSWGAFVFSGDWR